MIKAASAIHTTTNMRSRARERTQLLAAVAEAYYVDRLGQAQVADLFGLTRSAISRLLNEARGMGIVEIKVHHGFSLDERLSGEINDIFGISHVHVVRTTGLKAEPAKDVVARYTAGLIYRGLSEGLALSVTLGTMVHAVVRSLAQMPPIAIDVVQMCGSVGASDPIVDGHSTVRILSDAYRCRSIHLHAPFLVDTVDMRDALRRNVGNALCVELCRRSDVAIVGLGTLDATTSSLALGGHVSRELMSALSHRGALGDIGGFPIDGTGRCLQDDKYNPVIALSFDEFCAIPVRVGAAVGRHKAEIVCAALRGGTLSDLVIDSEIAQAVLNGTSRSAA